MLFTSLPPRTAIPHQRLAALMVLVCFTATLHNFAEANEETIKQKFNNSSHQSTDVVNNALINGPAGTRPLDTPTCYLKAYKSFERAAGGSIITRPVKVTAYASFGTSVTLIAPTLGASLPLGFLASMGSLAAADLSKQVRLGDRERFMGVVLEAAAYEKYQRSGVEPNAIDYPLMRALEKRVHGFFSRSNNLNAIATTINQLDGDPGFCNDANNMRFVHLKDKILEQINTES